MKTGKLVRWNDEKGYGFIRSESENHDIFIHISVLTHMSRRPIVGDVIFFGMEPDVNGKFKAVNAKIEGMPRLEPFAQSMPLVSIERKQNLTQGSQQPSLKIKRSNYRNHRYQRTGNRFISKLIYLAIFVSVVSAYEYFVSPKSNSTTLNLPMQEKVEQQQNQFHCQGKTHCSEMTSCEEATFYITNCPSTEMDGDGDGVPCESQWCN